MLKDFQPVDLEDAISYVLSFIKDNDRAALDSFKDDQNGFIGALHFSFGMGLRNEWFLWWYKGHMYPHWPDTKPLIVKWFNEKQIYHADDMSSIILTSVYRRYFDIPLDLENQIKKYHDFWLKQQGSINPMNYE